MAKTDDNCAYINWYMFTKDAVRHHCVFVLVPYIQRLEQVILHTFLTTDVSDCLNSDS